MSTRLRKRPVGARKPAGNVTDTRFGKLDRKMMQDFCNLIREGMPADATCDYLGISPASYYSWLNQGKSLFNTSEADIPQHMKIVAEFYVNFRRAWGDYMRERTHLLHGRDPATGKRTRKANWVREMTILERRDRKNFSRMDPQGGTDEDFDPDEAFL